MIKLTDLLGEEKAFTATSKETGNVSVFKTKAARDAAVKAGTHEKRKDDKEDAVDVPTGEKKPNMFSKDAGYDAPDAKSSKPKKSEPFNADKDEADFENALKGDGFSWYDGGSLEGVTTFGDESGNTVAIAAGDVYDSKSAFVVSGFNDDDPADVQSKEFDSKDDAIAYAKELGQKLKKQNSDEPTEEPKPKRQGNPEVNKATLAKAKELGITPQKLGKDEYKKKMAQAAVAALTDANFHSEARELISKLEGKPEWAEDPRKDAPSFDSPEYDEWRKTSVYSSEYYDADDDTEDLGVSAAQEAGWSGDDAIDSIAFTLRMNGFHNLADTIQSVIKENKSTKLGDLI